MRETADRELRLLGNWLYRRADLWAALSGLRNVVLLISLLLAESIFVPCLGRGGIGSLFASGWLRYALRMAFVLVAVFVWEKRSLASAGLRNFRLDGAPHRKEIVWTAILCLAMLPGYFFMPLPAFVSAKGSAGLLAWSGYVLACPALVEETIWRGYIFSRLSRATGILSATVISSILNALWHLPYYQRAFPESVVPLLAAAALMSAVLCLLTAFTGRLIGRFNIYPAIIVHWIGDGGGAALIKALL